MINKFIDLYLISVICSTLGLIAFNLKVKQVCDKNNIGFEFQITPLAMKGYLMVILIPIINTLAAIYYGIYAVSDNLMIKFLKRRGE